MKKAILVLICAVFVASIAIVNFLGLEIAIFQGYVYVEDIKVTELNVINGGDMYKITPYKTAISKEDGVEEVYFRFKYVEYDKDDEAKQNPNMVKLNYVVLPTTADYIGVAFSYDQKAYEGIINFYSDVETVEFLSPNKTIIITISSTDGHNVKKRIHVMCLSEEWFNKIAS